MTKKVNVFAVSLIALMTATAARADIASKAYVDQQIQPVESALSTHTSNADIHVTASDKTAWNAKEDADNKVTDTEDLTNGQKNSTTLYPSMATAVALVNESNEALTAAVTNLETTKQNKLTSTNVTTDGSGNVVTAVSAANGVVTVTKGTTLGSLATKSEVAEADLASALATKINGKADAATTLAGYGITNAYTKTEVDTSLALKQAKSDSTVAANGNYIKAGSDVKGNLGYLDSQVKSNADAISAETTRATTAEGAINTKIGTVTEGKTVVQMIQDAQTSATYDDTALAARVSANEGAITTLNGNASTSGSVANSIATALTDYTLKSVTASTGDGVVTSVSQSGSAVVSTKEKITSSHIASNAGILSSQLASGVQDSLTKADNALPAATYNSQIGTVNATNMGTTNGTVVGAIKEIHDSVAALDNTYATDSDLTSGLALKQDKTDSTATAGNYIQAGTGVGANLGLLDSQLKTTTDTANAAIPKPQTTCSDCVLHFNGTAYAWEEVGR